MTPEYIPNLEKIVEEARKFIGKSVPDEMVCTDVYVKAVEQSKYNLSKEMADHFKDLKHPYKVYSRFDQRYWKGVRHIKLLVEMLNPKGKFKNNPNDPYFYRRVQNVKVWQQKNKTYYPVDSDVELQPGMAIYWKPKNLPRHRRIFYSKEATHIGVISEIKDKKVTKVIHASYSNGKVVEDNHERILNDMVVTGYGSI